MCSHERRQRAVRLYRTATCSPTANAVPPFDDTTVLQPFPNAGLPSGAVIAASTGAPACLPTATTDSRRSSDELRARDTARAPPRRRRRPSRPFTAFGRVANQARFATGGRREHALERRRLRPERRGGSDRHRLSARFRGSSTRRDRGELRHDRVRRPRDVLAAHRGVRHGAARLDRREHGARPRRRERDEHQQHQRAGRHQDAAPIVQAATRTLISVAPAPSASRQSNGFAYLLAAGRPEEPHLHVYIFAPSCGGRPGPVGRPLTPSG